MNIPFTKLQRRADNSDCYPRSERLSYISLLGRTALRKTIPVWLVFLSIVLVQNAFGQRPDLEPKITVGLEQGLRLDIYSDRYEILYELPDYKIATDTILPSDLSQVNSSVNLPLQIIFGDHQMSLAYLFSHIEFAGDSYYELDSIGLPELPYRQLNLFLPDDVSGVDVSVYVEDVVAETFPYPYIPRRKIPLWLPRYELFLDNYYATDGRGFYDGYYDVSDIFGFMNTKGISLGLFPLRYDPSTNSAEIIKRARYVVKLQHKFVLEPISLYDWVREYVSGEHYGNEMHFYDTFTGMTWKEKVADKGNYMILTASHYKDALHEFVAYKRSIGYNVRVYQVPSDVSNNATQIRKFIRDKWWHSEDERPRYLLLVGNPKELTYSGGILGDENNPPTDIYYSCLEHEHVDTERKYNLFPEVFVGRWSVYKDEHVENITKKTIKTENALYHTPKYRKHISMFSGTGSGEKTFWRQLQKAQKIIDCSGHPSTIFNGMNNIGYWDMLNELRGANGRTPFVFVYRGHGAQDELWRPYHFLTGSVEFVNNFDLPFQPFGFGFACLTSDYSKEGNFGEGFTTQFRGGGVSYLGSTTLSYRKDNNKSLKILALEFKRKTNLCIGSFASYVKSNTYKGCRTKWNRLHAERYNLFGDPSLRMYGISFESGNPGSSNAPAYDIVGGGHTPNSAKGLEVYPTVVTDVVNIATTGNGKISAVYISDIVGRRIKRCLYLSSAIDLSDIPNGTYFLSVVFDDNSIETTKIIINH